MSQARSGDPGDSEGGAGKGDGHGDGQPGAPKTTKPTVTTVANILLALADKDRQLRDLTEQSLGLLEQLAEAQRRDGDRVRLGQRVEQLERLLADSRRRLRTVGGAVLRDGSTGLDAPAGEIVLCGGPAAAARACAKALPGTAITWIGKIDAIPTDAGNRDGVQWIAADAVHTPAQLWNLAMAATHADAVLLLAPGARLAQPLRIPACTADPSVVLGQPRCRRGDAIELGWQGDDLLHLAALPAPLATVPVEVPFACPQAFVVRRPAFVTVGLFDEAVLGELALAEYALRAQARGFRVLGIPELEVQLPVEAHGSSDPHVDRDRLLVLAAHRPAVLGTALAHDHALWQLDRAAVPAFLAELFGRLPAAEGGREARDLLACIAVAMVEHATPGARIDAVLRQRRRQLLAALAPAEAAPTPKVDPATSTITDVPAALADVFELERRLAAVAEGDLARSRGERDALAVQLTQTRSERDEVAAQLAQSRTELASTQQRVGVLEREFEMIAQAIGMVGRPEIEEVHGRLRRLHDDAEQLARTIAAAGAPDPAGLIDELEAIRAQLADSRKLLAERNQWIALLLREVTRRRLLARKLLEHEQAFLAQMGRAP